MKTKYINSFEEFQNAIFAGDKEININKSIVCHHSIILPEQTTLQGIAAEDGTFPILMFNNGDGIGVTANNTILNVNIHAQVDSKGIYNTIIKEDLGTFVFSNIVMTGQFSLITRQGVMQANILLDNVHVTAADTRKYAEQPQKYGVNVIQGAITIYNLNPNPDSVVAADIKNIAIGAQYSPVVGSGLFIGGAGDAGGKVYMNSLHTLAIYSTGKIPFGVADMITAAVFVVNGAKIENIVHDGAITTYGVNDMVLDAWGEVGSWVSNYPITSYGPSGVGFVNFGVVDTFIVNAPLTTFGLGARGYNQYDGTVANISFESISTYGDGSVGIQISKKIGNLTVKGDVVTHGSIGNSLVKGVNVQLPAYALSIKEGGYVENLNIQGNITTYGDNVVSYIVDKGEVKSFDLAGSIKANGKDSIDKKLS